ncbi:MAG: hypothetical protein WAK16_03930 [Candidatus Cybelea sp.]
MAKPLAAALLIALVTACNSSTTTFTSPTAAPGTSDTDFVVSGRYIDVSDAPLGAAGARNAAGVKFFVKGMVYSPTPIGKGVGDPPMLDDFLRDANAPIWSRDLPLMRKMGVNAIHVYNVVPPPYDKDTGPIVKFLDAAWNGGKNPVYVIMSIHFNGDKLFDNNAVQALATQYHDLDQKYAKYPAVMGIAISNEIGAKNFITDPKWWTAFNVIATAAKKGFIDGGDSSKIVTTSEADGNIGAVQEGEKYGAAIDVWGVNLYRGRTFTNLFEQIRQFTKKPVLLTEYGATAAYHTAWKNTYTWKKGPKALGMCVPDSRDGPPSTDAKELPASGDPGMPGLVDYVTNNASTLWSGYNDGGVVSGGFYFEWSDEWWKSGSAAKHIGSDAFNGHYPGCAEDSAWYGLNAVAPGSGALNDLSARPTKAALRQTWAQQY